MLFQHKAAPELKNSVVDQCGEMNQCTGQDNKVGIGMQYRSRQIGINGASAGEESTVN
jgi:hypothetical protein